jgi:hypothetical protein
VESFSCKYWSKTPQGDSLLVSGNIYLPRKRKLNGIIIANHYTIAKKCGSTQQCISNGMYLCFERICCYNARLCWLWYNER